MTGRRIDLNREEGNKKTGEIVIDERMRRGHKEQEGVKGDREKTEKTGTNTSQREGGGQREGLWERAA